MAVTKYELAFSKLLAVIMSGREFWIILGYFYRYIL